MVKVPDKILLFHFTAIQNLDSILSCGYLKSNNMLSKENIQYTNIAYANIQHKRHVRIVPNTNTTLHDYVPFMFAPRSPMLYTINQGNVVEAEENNQEHLVYLVTNFDAVKDLDYVFTNYHAILEYAEFYTNSQDLDKIQWHLFFEPPLLGGYCKIFMNNLSNPKYAKRKEARQAEFLIRDSINIEKILYIAVFNLTAKQVVEEKLRSLELNIDVQIKKEWYF
ncbi:MAG: DUF4433 domain-containing protein [Alphaproteobacteria bacterium]|nr:DUF4433 domain-containing protein [Alphaproteobacteria bacterium]